MIGVSSLDPEDTLGLMTAWLQKNAKSLISNTDEGSYQWVVKSTDLPESWRDVKEVLTQKRSAATIHPDRVAQL
jgi:hypothetical protein